MSDDKARCGEVKVDSRGYILIGGIKMCRVKNGQVQVYDKNRHRSRRLGSDQVCVPVDVVVKALEEAKEEEE